MRLTSSAFVTRDRAAVIFAAPEEMEKMIESRCWVAEPRSLARWQLGEAVN